MIPYDAEKLLLFLEEEEFIVNKVKKMKNYSERDEGAKSERVQRVREKSIAN